MDGSLCLHCTVRKASCSRGLCNKCYSNKKIRKAYPLARQKRAENNQSMTEIEAIVAEQQSDLPDWWDEESRHQKQSAYVIPFIRRNPQGQRIFRKSVGVHQ